MHLHVPACTAKHTAAIDVASLYIIRIKCEAQDYCCCVWPSWLNLVASLALVKGFLWEQSGVVCARI